jgi:hypothetical protein
LILINKTNLTQEQKYSRNLFLLSILMKLRMKKIWSDLIQSFTQWEVKIKGPMYHNCLERDYMNTFKIFLYPISNKQMIVTHSNTYFVKLFYWKKKKKFHFEFNHIITIWSTIGYFCHAWPFTSSSLWLFQHIAINHFILLLFIFNSAKHLFLNTYCFSQWCKDYLNRLQHI